MATTELFGNRCNRKLFHLKITGKKRKILPIYLHVAQEDVEWSNTQVSYEQVMSDVVSLFLENIHEVEEAARDDTRSFARLPSGQYINIMYLPTKELQGNSQNVLNISSDHAELEAVTSFTVLAWVFPKQQQGSAAREAMFLEQRGF